MSIWIRALSLAALVTGLVACHRQEQTQTVDWYIKNRQELEATLTACLANPGELAATPNCINAAEAKNKLAWSAKGRGIVLDMDEKEGKP